jgi:cell division protein FtsW (lipid II flippase)
VTTRRSTELGLVLLAALITAGAYVLVALGRTADLPPNLVPFLLVVLALLGVAHLATRRLAPGADPVLLPLALVLNGIGYVFIARLRTDLAGLQATWTAIGIGAYVVTLALVRRTADLARYTWTAAAAGVGLLLLPFLPVIGTTVNGSRIWIRLGPMSFQPGELAKVLLAVFFAAYLTDRRELLAAATRTLGPLRLPEARHLAPVLAAWGVSVMVMVGQRDLGSSLLFFTLFVVVLWVATERSAYLAVGATLFLAGAALAANLFDHVQRRIDIWIDPWATRQSSGYQIVQAVYALADGGVSGTGLGLGDPRRVPEVHNDFIFAAIGEELGLFGASAVLISYLLIIGAGLRVAVRADRTFDKLLATGLTTVVGVQAFLIIGGVTRVVPLTGVTLPFVSYGGSSLLANYVILGLLIRLSHTTAQRLGELP